MLQVPAMLDEEEITATIPNHHLICCSYFYLSLVRKMQGDEWQAALHFLQAVSVSPRLVRTEFAPELCESLFPATRISEKKKEINNKSLKSVSLKISEDEVDEAIRQMARRYKECLTYYQVMLYGKTPWWHGSGGEQSVLTLKELNTVSSTSVHQQQGLRTSNMYEKVHPLDPQEDEIHIMADKSKGFVDFAEYGNNRKDFKQLDSVQVESKDKHRITSIRCLKDMLKETQSNTPTSTNSRCGGFRDKRDLENREDRKCYRRTRNADHIQPEKSNRMLNNRSLLPHAPHHPECEQLDERKMVEFDFGTFTDSKEDDTPSFSECRDKKNNSLKCDIEGGFMEDELQPLKFQLFDYILFTSLYKQRLNHGNCKESSREELKRSSSLRNSSEVHSHSRRDYMTDVSRLLEKCVKDNTADIASNDECLTNSSGTPYAFLKDVILDQLLMAISTSKEEREIRASVSMLTSIISRNKSIIEDIKKKGLRLCDLASALKKNVHEAAILIYLINPSPLDIKTMELLPTLVEIICTSHSYKRNPESLLLTPHAASLMIIEELVTSFDYDTNNMHLAAISSPHVLCGLLEVARNNNLEEFLSLTTILIKCIQFDEQCRKYVSQFTPVSPFIHLLQTDNNRAKYMALEYFHEILCIPRSSAINLLHRIQTEGSDNVMQILKYCIHQLQSDHQLLAANILLQLDTLNPLGKSAPREEAVQVLLRSLASQGTSEQILAALILSNLSGTYAWTGEPYTAAWLLRKTGLTSIYHQNMIRNFNWLDPSLQDTNMDLWCSKVAKSIIQIGDPIFHALGRGLRSKMKRVSRDCLVAIAWLGCQISKCPDSLRFSACEILLSGIEQFLHPGVDLEERLLACLCVYNYASGRGKQKLIHFSEGVKESLRRLSSVSWMAEELHRVAEYYMPNISRISCVHTQILEAGQNFGTAVCSLIYYKGLLFSGYSDGSIKVWDIRGHSATLLWNIKEHRKSVTCFSLFEPSDSLLSGSADKTIRMWKMIQRKLECIEVIVLKEPIHHLRTYGQTVFATTRGPGIKQVNEARTVKDIFKSKHVKGMAVAHGKLYVGCRDSSIQEYSIAHNRELEIKTPSRSWMKQNKPINSVVAYRDWLYSASTFVECSTFKEWKRNGKPQISIPTGKGDNLLAMEVVEDFLYLISSSSANNIQIWLRGAQKKVGRISAGSKITSLLTANDTILCGTEMGLIKGWIPL